MARQLDARKNQIGQRAKLLDAIVGEATGEIADAAHKPKKPAKPERVIDARLKPKQESLFDD